MVDQIPNSESDILEDLKLTRGPIIPYKGGYYSVNYSLYRVKDGHIVELTINERGLTSLPENIGSLNFLYRLELKGNRINSLPESIGNLTSLSILDIRNNNLTSLPESFRNIKFSNFFRFKGNRFRSLTGFSDEFLERLPDNSIMDLDLTPKGAKLLSDHRYEELAIYYKKSAKKLALQYLSDPKSLTEDEIERIFHEIGNDGLESLKKVKEMKLAHYQNLLIEPPKNSKYFVKILTNLDNAAFSIEITNPSMVISQIFSETNIDNSIPNPNQYCNQYDLNRLIRCSQIHKGTGYFSSQIYHKKKLVQRWDVFKAFPGTHHIIDGQNVYTVEFDLVASRGLIKEIYDC